MPDKPSDEELCKTQRLLMASIESLNGMHLFSLDKSYNYLFFNAVHKEFMKKIHDKSIEIGMNFFDCIPDSIDRRTARLNFDRAFDGEAHSVVEKYGEKECLFFETFHQPIIDEKGAIAGVTVSAHDITERMHNDQALQKTSNDLQMMFKNMVNAFIVWESVFDENGKYVSFKFGYFNDAYERISGVTQKDVRGKNVFEVWPTTEQSWVEAYGSVAVSGISKVFDMYHAPTQGWYHCNAYRPTDSPSQVCVFFEDITERKIATQILAAEKERLAVTLRSIGDGVITTDINGNITMLNKAAETLTGWLSDEATGKLLQDVFIIINQLTRERSEDPVTRVLKTDTIVELSNHTCLISRDGREIVIGDSGAPIRDNEGKVIGTVLVFRDMTEKEKLQDSILRAQRLESLGILAGGIAHDFNNLLGGIFGYVDLANEECTDTKAAGYLAKALDTIERARALTQQLLTFAKGGMPVRKIESLFPFVETTVQFMLSGSNISCIFNIQKDLWLCNFDRNQIGQVIDNIVINAKQAMPNGGKITLTAQNITLEKDSHPSLPQGTYVKISIKDSGAGIPKELFSKIFDSFFTTKATGNGLGLSTCYSIVNRHDGCIDVESELGKGSTFHIYLPATSKQVSHSIKETNLAHTGEGTFLIMDDNEEILEIVSEMLISFGYAVVKKDNGNDVIDYFIKEQSGNRHIAGIILDLTVRSGAGGKETAKTLRKLDTSVPIFVASGYAEDPVMANPAMYGFTASICKPFRKHELEQLLKTYLVRPPKPFTNSD